MSIVTQESCSGQFGYHSFPTLNAYTTLNYCWIKSSRADGHIITTACLFSDYFSIWFLWSMIDCLGMQMKTWGQSISLLAMKVFSQPDYKYIKLYETRVKNISVIYCKPSQKTFSICHPKS